MNFVTHLECALCRARHDHTTLQNLCTECQRPLWVKYDLAAIGKRIGKEAFMERASTLWRYTELLPVRNLDEVVSLGETMTPLLETRKLAAHFGVAHLWVKDESRLPTGSFKARGMALAISKAKEFGVTRVACPTAGNAGGAMAAYAARAGMEAYVFMPQDTPGINQKECFLAGAKTWLVNGLI
ncbi:MAG: pyridoxal-phosphate dependent enzyme, partial [Acidobacteriales bacterium]|nr:pyridoxal-phosphate dependent enzyme [Terriglobales bacterium]